MEQRGREGDRMEHRVHVCDMLNSLPWQHAETSPLELLLVNCNEKEMQDNMNNSSVPPISLVLDTTAS